MSYNSDLQSNNEELQDILRSINELPEAETAESEWFLVTLDGEGKPNHSAEEIIAAYNEGKYPILCSDGHSLIAKWSAGSDSKSATFMALVAKATGDDARLKDIYEESITITTKDEIASVLYLLVGDNAIIEDLQNNKLDKTALPEAINTALAQAKESGEFDGDDGITPHIGANGNWFIGNTDTGKPSQGETGGTGPTGPQGPAGSDASVTKTSINTALGYTPSDPREYAVSVKALGAKGNGYTDDTAVIQSALAANRTVYIPGGTYKLSGELVIRDNCQLELAQDVVLNFTQTSGNCITVNRSSWLKGNHATMFVPYSFAGNVIYADTTLHTSARDVQPWTHYDPQWKTARYVSDINICKYDSAGRHWSEHGDTAGTAIYISATGTTPETPRSSTFMWGTNLSGIRIAGAFEYGIRAQNFLKGWLHEMRLEAYIENCKIGLSLEDCNKVYFSGAIQPKKAADGTPYAMHGVQLIRSIDTELSGCRVWDWDATNSLWTFDKTNVNQHIAMYGNCKGTILNDYLYYNLPTGFSDIRELIYTDTLSNFNSLIIVQEPITKWFAPIDNLPYFNNGIDGNQRLLLKSEQDALFQNKQVPNFTNRLPTAIDNTGAVFNGTGYKIGGYLKETTGEFVASSYYGCTGYIRCNANSVIRIIGINWSLGYCGIMLFDSDKNRIMNMSSEAVTPGTSYYFGYSEIENGFMLTLKGRAEQAGTYYFRLSFEAAGMGTNPIVTVDEEISYFQDGFLKDGIYVSADYIHGAEYKFMMANQKVVEISTASTDEQYPTAKAVYDLVTSALGSYVNEVDALIGGGS